MIENNLESMEKMSYKFLLSAGFLGVLLVSGCASFDRHRGDAEYSALHNQSAPATTTATPAATTSRQTCPVAQYPGEYDARCAAEDEFVNYTKVAADYREFGERTPRDYMVVDGGAGSNMSATIPPMLEGEVVDYETAVAGSGGEMETYDDGTGNGGEYAADDPVEDWLAEEGKNLKAILTEWSERSGWRLVWNTNRNYTLTAGAMFRGRFADVSSALIRAFARARPAPIATFYKGNRVLVVETMEDENAYE